MKAFKILIIILLLFVLPIYILGCRSIEENDSEEYPHVDEENEIGSSLKAEHINIKIIELGGEPIKWCYNDQKVAFSLMDDQEYSSNIYIWRVGEKEPKKVYEHDGFIREFLWSFDSKYLIADSGTGVIRTGTIINCLDCKKIGEIEYVEYALWSPDSKRIAFSTVSDIEASIVYELVGTMDLTIYNLETKEKEIIIAGKADYHFGPEMWKDRRTLIYKKYYFEEHTVETFEYNF